MASTATTQNLSDLARIITDGVSAIEAESSRRNVKYPSLDDLPSPESLEVQQSFAQDALPVIAAAYQIVATLMSPQSFYLKMLMATQQSVSVGVAEAGHVAEILREAGPAGLHVSEIAKHSHLDPRKLAHCLRMLTTLHAFKEVSPDCFANNRVSAMLDTGKLVKDILADPEAKYDGAPGLAALTGTQLDEYFKGFAHAVETFTDPATSHSQEPSDSALQRALGNTNRELYEWYDLPENAFRLRRFGNAMQALEWSADANGGFEWGSLSEGSLVVDVGGGFGGMDMDLAKEFKHIKYIVQDRQPVVERANKMWEERGNEDVTSGLVSFQPHDFFTPQPVTNASVFLLRYILHNWSDAKCITILRHLRASASVSPPTRLVIVDAILQYNCPTDGKWKDVPGGEAPLAPVPLLPNWGIGASDSSYVDILLMSVTNTQERTLDEVGMLLEATGWKLERVHRFPPPALPQVVAVPV